MRRWPYLRIWDTLSTERRVSLVSSTLPNDCTDRWRDRCILVYVPREAQCHDVYVVYVKGSTDFVLPFQLLSQPFFLPSTCIGAGTALPRNTSEISTLMKNAVIVHSTLLHAIDDHATFAEVGHLVLSPICMSSGLERGTHDLDQHAHKTTLHPWIEMFA
eukprot:3402578-Amphidinium_carterae.1